MDWKTSKIIRSWQFIVPTIANAILYGLFATAATFLIAFSEQGRLMLSEKETYLFLFSTVAQSFFAFAAFFGALAIFPFHRHEQEYDGLITNVRDLLQSHCGTEVAVMSNAEIWEHCRKILSQHDNNNSAAHEAIGRVVSRYERLLLRKAILRTRTLSFISFTIITAGTSIMLIPAALLFADIPDLGGIAVSVIFGMSFTSMVLGWQAIKQMLEESV